MSDTVIALTGPTGSGKDNGAKYFNVTKGLPVYKFSTIMSAQGGHLGILNSTPNLIAISELVREGRRPGHGFFEPGHEITTRAVDLCLQELDIEPNDGDRTKFRNLMLRLPDPAPGFGQDAYAKVIRRKCAEDPRPTSVACGLRLETDVTTLQTLPNFQLILVTAPIEVLYEATRNRGEKREERNMTLEQFRARLAASTEGDIERIGRKYASFIYSNIGTEKAYHGALDMMYDAITGPQRPRADIRS